MPSTNTKNDKSFVGGTKLNNKYASIGMDFENQDKTLTAKKSYFILNDKIVFLGTGIKVLIHQRIQLQVLKIAKQMGINYLKMILKLPLQMLMLRKPIQSF